MNTSILERIRKKDIRVGVIGPGYAGLPLAIEFADKNIKAIGFDTAKKTKLKNGIS